MLQRTGQASARLDAGGALWTATRDKMHESAFALWSLPARIAQWNHASLAWPQVRVNLGTIAAYARTHSTCTVLFAHKSDAASFGVAAQFIG